MAWKHDDLAADLAGYLMAPDRMVWTDMQLGPSGSPRPDVYTLQKSYSRPAPAAFEVKISRSDLRSDTTSGKWQKYLQFASSVTFAVPDGLCTVADVPDGCGLIVRKEQVWRYARRPTIQRVEPPFSACMKLLIDGVSRTYRPAKPQPRAIDTWRVHDGVRQKFGEAVALAARDLLAARTAAESVNAVAEYERERLREANEAYKARLRQQAESEAGEWIAIREELCEWLGIKGATSTWAVRRRLTELRDAVDADARVVASNKRVEIAQRALEHALSTLTPTDAPPVRTPAGSLPRPAGGLFTPFHSSEVSDG